MRIPGLREKNIDTKDNVSATAQRIAITSFHAALNGARAQPKYLLRYTFLIINLHKLFPNRFLKIIALTVPVGIFWVCGCGVDVYVGVVGWGGGGGGVEDSPEAMSGRRF